MPTKTKKKVKRPTVTVTLAMFDTREPSYRAHRVGIPIDYFAPLTSEEYVPHGDTNLFDAVGRFVAQLDQVRSKDTVTIGLLCDESGSIGMYGMTQSIIDGVNEFVEGMSGVDAVDPGAGGKVLAVIATDGEENSSREFTQQMVQDLIARKEHDGYTFIFLGAGLDAWALGAHIGLSGGSTGQMVSANATPAGAAAAFASVTNDAMGYLGDHDSYVKHRSSAGGMSMRSVTDAGAEVSSNINAAQATPKPVLSADTTQAQEALKRAQKAVRDLGKETDA